jgi:nucleotide-binding universal stress UspA family protein
MKRFKNILVAVDDRQEEHPALQLAVRLAEHNHAKLKVVDVVPEFSWIARLAMPDSEHTRQVLTDDKLRNLEAIAAPLRVKGLDVATKVLHGKTSGEIRHEVLRSNHDLVLRVTKGALSRRTAFFGTTSMRLLRTCPCAVWLVPADALPRFSRVLVAVDPAPGDDAQEAMNRTVFELGRSIANFENGQFHVVHVWELIGSSADESWSIPGQMGEAMRKAETKVTTALDRFLSPYELSHRSEGVHLLRDDHGPGHAISKLARQQGIELIVMGTVARTGIAGALMGNTAEQVIDRVECSVLTIKPNGFISPETLPVA